MTTYHRPDAGLSGGIKAGSRHAEAIELRPPEWTRDALCAEVDHDAFFPGAGLGAYQTAQFAKSICAICPVRDQCLAHALSMPDVIGIWGGTNETERRNLRKARKTA